MPNYEEDEYLDLLHHTLEKGETRGNERTARWHSFYLYDYK